MRCSTVSNRTMALITGSGFSLGVIGAVLLTLFVTGLSGAAATPRISSPSQVVCDCLNDTEVDVSGTQCYLILNFIQKSNGACNQSPCSDSGGKCIDSFDYWFSSPCNNTIRHGEFAVSCGGHSTYVIRGDGYGGAALIDLFCWECSLSPR